MADAWTKRLTDVLDWLGYVGDVGRRAWSESFEISGYTVGGFALMAITFVVSLVRASRSADAGAQKALLQSGLDALKVAVFAFAIILVMNLFLRAPYLLLRESEQSRRSELASRDTLIEQLRAGTQDAKPENNKTEHQLLAKTAEAETLRVERDQLKIELQSTQAHAYELQQRFEDKAKRERLVNELGRLIGEGQALDRRCHNEKDAPPEHEAEEWAKRTEELLKANLGDGYVNRFRSGAGLPLSVTTIQSQAHSTLSGGIRIRLARLEQFSQELAR
jgi:hypothetical protein